MKCPFCGTEHEVKPHLNIICGCGGKYYIHLGEWFNRTTGQKIKPSDSLIHCKECGFRASHHVEKIPVCTGPMAYAATPDEWFCAAGQPKGGDL